MKKILFPTDFSQASHNAFRYALALAAKSDAGITTLHVYSPPLSPTIAHFNFTHNNEGLFAWPEFEYYNADVRTLRQIAGNTGYDKVRLTHILKAGATATEIIKMSVVENADIIVIGTSGASGLREWVKSSITEEVINRSPVPVMAVPRDFCKAGIAAILYLSDNGSDDETAIRWTGDFSKLLGASTEILQIKQHGGIHDMVAVREQNASYFAPMKFWIKSNRHRETAIIQYVLKSGIDALAMRVRHKGFITRFFYHGLSAKLAFHSPVPLITIPSQ